MTHDEMEDVKRHFGVVADGLRSDIRLVAEGHAALDRKMDGVRQDLQELRGDVRSEIRPLAEGHQALRQEVADFRKDVQGEFREVRSLIKLSYAELDERVKSIERDLASLRTRLDQIDGKQT